MSASRYFQVLERDTVLVLRMQSVNLDREAANEFGNELLALLGETNSTRLVVNLSAIDKLSSPALAKLIVLDKRIAAAGGRMVICEATETVRQVMSLAWANRAGEEPVTEDEAVAELNAWQPA